MHHDLGDITILFVTGALSAGILLPISSAPFEGRLSLGFRTGYGRLTGHADNAATISGEVVSGNHGGPFLRLAAASTTRFGAGLSVEVGYDVYGNVGSVLGTPTVEMKGPRLSVQVDFLYYLRRALE